MDLRKLKTILELFENSHIDEIELVEGEERIRMVKNAAAAQPDAAAAPPATVVVAPPVAGQQAAAPPPAEPAAGPAPEAKEGDKEGFVFTAPMVGTFYVASAPDKPPFVKVGDSVSEGDVVCIIEAMKLMNELRAPVSGRVVSIHVSNGEPVAYGDRLMTIG